MTKMLFALKGWNDKIFGNFRVEQRVISIGMAFITAMYSSYSVPPLKLRGMTIDMPPLTSLDVYCYREVCGSENLYLWQK